MFPFQAPFPHPTNQNPVEGNNGGSAPHQGMLPNPPGLTNSNNNGQFPCSSSAHQNPLVHPQLNAFNPSFPVPFNGLNPLLNNLNGNLAAAAIASMNFLNAGNFHPSMQNMQMGRPFMGSVPQGFVQPNGQFGSQNTLQQLSSAVAALQQLNSAVASPQCGYNNFPQNMNQIPMQQNGQQMFMHNRLQVSNQNMRPQNSGGMPRGQFSPYNQPQNMNQVSGFQHNQFPANPVRPSQGVPFGNQTCSNPSLGCSNQGNQAVASQNPAFLMNQQLGPMNSNGVAQHNTHGQNSFTSTSVGQNAIRPPHITGPVQMQQNKLQPATPQRSQGDHGKDGGNDTSNLSPGNTNSKNFTRNPHASANPRFQNTTCQPRPNAKGNFRNFNGKGQKGQDNEETRKSHLVNSGKHMGVERRSLPLSYTDQEIKIWREERRKNYPSRINKEQILVDKGTESKVIDINAQKRRQQLKEILAKQAELGIEVAQLPPDYLSDSENKACEKENEPKRWDKKGRFQNKYGKRKGRNNNANRFAKKQKLGDKDSLTSPALNKRKPTLLQKLLSADIKREKSHLLQVFRFMVMNSFFKDYPEKPLEYPQITIKDSNSKSKIIDQKYPAPNGNGISAVDEDGLVEEFEGSKDYNEDDCDNENEAIVEESEKSEGEEGEITDQDE